MLSIQCFQGCLRAPTASANGCRARNHRCGHCRHRNTEAIPKTEGGHARTPQEGNRAHRGRQCSKPTASNEFREVIGGGLTASNPIWRWRQGDQGSKTHSLAVVAPDDYVQKHVLSKGSRLGQEHIYGHGASEHAIHYSMHRAGTCQDVAGGKRSPAVPLRHRLR